MKWRAILGVLFIGGFSLTGCVTQSNSGVLARDSNTFVITVKTAPIPLGNGSAESRRVAYSDATAHCQQQGKRMLIVNEASGPATVNLTFQCIPSEEHTSK